MKGINKQSLIRGRAEVWQQWLHCGTFDLNKESIHQWIYNWIYIGEVVKSFKKQEITWINDCPGAIPLELVFVSDFIFMLSVSLLP